MRFLSFGDIHCPLHSESALNWLYGQIEEWGPDIIVANGDAYDGGAWSRWESEADWTIMDEYRQWARIVRKVNQLAPNARRVWLYGNHEDNLSQPGRLGKKYRNMVHWKDWAPEDGGLRDAVEGWHIIPRYGSTVRYCVGPITWTHGTKCNVYAARDEARMLGTPHGLTISGHTHRITPVQRDFQAGNIPADYWFCNPGCLMDWDKAHYIQRSNYQGWGHGCVVGEIHSNDKTLLREGRKLYARRIWDAEVRVLRIARDCL